MAKKRKLNRELPYSKRIALINDMHARSNNGWAATMKRVVKGIAVTGTTDARIVDLVERYKSS